jgi:hypothetical protein
MRYSVGACAVAAAAIAREKTTERTAERLV